MFDQNSKPANLTIINEKQIPNQGPDPQKRSTIHPKYIPNSNQIFQTCVLRFWIKVQSILTPKSVQEPSKIDPESTPEPPRHHPSTKSLPKTSQEPPQTSQRPSQDRFRITFSSKNEPPNHNFRARSLNFGGRRHGACPIK